MRFLSTLIASTLGVLLAFALVCFVGLIFFFALAAASDQTPAIRSGSVLVVTLDGPVPETVSRDPFAQAFADEPAYSLRDFTTAMKTAAADDRIEGVWLQIKGVDASWATLEAMRKALLDFQESGKPLLASSDDYAMDEADYFLASAADSVFASQQAMFEFNGFYITVEFYQNLLDKLDVQPQVVRAGRFKSAVEPFLRDDLSPENEEQLGAILQAQSLVFMEAVADSRGLTADAWEELAEERAILTAPAAYEAGLLDGLLFEDQVADLWKAYLEVEADDDLRTVDLDDYVGVPPSEVGLEVEEEGEIAVVYATGTIVSGKSGAPSLFGGENLGAETFNKAMEEARESDEVEAVVLRIDSPGGSAAASDAMWREIALTQEVKPVIVSMGGVAASGGYWIATAADTIVAEPLTITGSIGVFALFFDISGFFENKLGITFDAVTTSPYADLFSGVRSLTPREQDLLENYTDLTYEAFLEKVALSRGLDVAMVDSIGQGRVWTGLQAKELGLVDVLGDLETAIRIAAEKAGMAPDRLYRVRTLPRPKTFAQQLAEGLNARATRAWLNLGASPAERTLLQHASLLQSLSRAHGTVQARLPMDLRIE